MFLEQHLTEKQCLRVSLSPPLPERCNVPCRSVKLQSAVLQMKQQHPVMDWRIKLTQLSHALWRNFHCRFFLCLQNLSHFILQRSHQWSFDESSPEFWPVCRAVSAEKHLARSVDLLGRSHHWRHYRGRWLQVQRNFQCPTVPCFDIQQK